MRPRSPGGGQAGDVLRGLQKSCPLARPARGAVPPFVLQGRRLVGTCPSGGRPLLAGSPRGAKPALGDSQTRGVAMPPAAGRVREGPGGPGHTAQARLQRQNLLPELWAGGRGSRCHRGLLRAPGVSSTSARLGAPGVPGPVASSLPPSSLGPLPRVCVSTRHLPLTRSPVTLEGDPPWWPRLAQLHLRRPRPCVRSQPRCGLCTGGPVSELRGPPFPPNNARGPSHPSPSNSAQHSGSSRFSAIFVAEAPGSDAPCPLGGPRSHSGRVAG